VPCRREGVLVFWNALASSLLYSTALSFIRSFCPAMGHHQQQRGNNTGLPFLPPTGQKKHAYRGGQFYHLPTKELLKPPTAPPTGLLQVVSRRDLRVFRPCQGSSSGRRVHKSGEFKLNSPAAETRLVHMKSTRHLHNYSGCNAHYCMF
jgi:hypothetical protein